MAEIRAFLVDSLLGTKSLQISRLVSHFYGTEYEIWAGFGPVGSTENFDLGCKVCYF
jgi:hypothetical protein